MTFDLGPLRADEAKQLASSVDVPDDVRERCLERAAGNPLFLDQLLRNVDELVRTDLPASLRGLILARIDRLGARDKEVISGGFGAWGSVLIPTSSGTSLAEANWTCAPRARRNAPPSGQEVAFGHALIRDAAYRSLLREKRQALHRRAAEWFEDLLTRSFTPSI